MDVSSEGDSPAASAVGSVSREDSGVISHEDSPGSPAAPFMFLNEIKSLKSLLMSALVSHTSPEQISHPNPDQRIDLLRGEIGLEAFSNFMRSCELPHLASEEVFNIFDINRDGTIELKEFLLVEYCALLILL